MSDTTTTKAQRLPKTTQGLSLVPAIALEIIFNGDVLGSLECPQEDLLSRGGNVLYRGQIARGWNLPGTPDEALALLAFKANGEMLGMSETGVHLTEPRTGKDGKVIVGSGNEPIVSHHGVINVSTDEAVAADYMVNVFAKKIVKPFKGKDAGYSLRVQSFPKGSGRAAGPQIVGEASGLVITTDF